MLAAVNSGAAMGGDTGLWMRVESMPLLTIAVYCPCGHTKRVPIPGYTHQREIGRPSALVRGYPGAQNLGDNPNPLAHAEGIGFEEA